MQQEGGDYSNNCFLVPYKHFGDIVNVEKEENYSYVLIKSLIENNDSIKNSYRIPFNNVNNHGKDFRGGFGFTDVYFVGNTIKVLNDPGYRISIFVKNPGTKLNTDSRRGPYLIPPSYQSKDTLRQIFPDLKTANRYLLPFTIIKTYIDAFSDGVTELQIDRQVNYRRENQKSKNNNEGRLLNIKYFILAQNDKFVNMSQSFDHELSKGQRFSIKIRLLKKRANVLSSLPFYYYKKFGFRRPESYDFCKKLWPSKFEYC